MIQIPEIKPGACEFEVEKEDWCFRLVRFKGKPKLRVPVLICYAFINRPYVLDLHEKVSVVKKMVDSGFDVWMVDWGYPKRADRYLQLSDYLDFLDRCVEHIMAKKGVDGVTLHGYCLGATLCVIYASIFPQKVKNLVLQAPPVDFYTTNTLALWARSIDPEKIVRTLGNATGDMLNLSFLLADPIRLVVGKYQSLIDNISNMDFVRNFFYMDFWIFDSPAVPGGVYIEYIRRWYQNNEVIEEKFEYRGKRVELKNITMPVLVLAAEKDHITPPDSVTDFFEKIPSNDKKCSSPTRGTSGLLSAEAPIRKSGRKL